MAQELKDLIQKIQEEGVEAAENKARTIEEEASRRAAQIIKDAGKKAEALVSDARQEIARLEKGGEESIRQAGRNVIIALKKEIAATLDKIVLSDVRKALSGEELVKIIRELVKSQKEAKEGAVISLRDQDRQNLEKTLLGSLKEEAKKGITLKTAEDIRGGFIISYDLEKSHYDFTDKALTEYIGLYLRPKLKDILKVAKSR